MIATEHEPDCMLSYLPRGVLVRAAGLLNLAYFFCFSPTLLDCPDSIAQIIYPPPPVSRTPFRVNNVQ